MTTTQTSLQPTSSACPKHHEIRSSQSEWFKCYDQLARQMYILRRTCHSLSLLATSTVNPRHPVPNDHLYLIELSKVANGLGHSPAKKPSPGRLSLSSRWWPRFFTSVYRQFLKVPGLCSFLFVALRESLTIGFLKVKFGFLLRRNKKSPASVIIRTDLVVSQSSDRTPDYIYGMLPHLLQERGVKYMLVYDGPGADTVEFARAVFNQGHIPAVPELMLVPLWAPLAIACEQVLTNFNLRRVFGRAYDSNLSALSAAAAGTVLSTETRKNVLSYYAAREAVKTWRPKAFLTQYQGHPLEKLAWHGVKAANKECLTVGYQFTVIMPHSLELTRPNHRSWELAAPDVALCLSEVTRNLMRPGHEALGTKLIPYGSFSRALSRSLQVKPKPERRTILVVPEGRESEFLFDFATRVATIMPDYHFILRCHPLRPFALVRTSLSGNLEKLSNVEVSDRISLLDDCARSSVVLYHGSSAVMVAVLCGLKPVYLHDDEQYESDPLLELNNWRECVSSEIEMDTVVRRYETVTEDLNVSDWQSATEHVNAYAIPVDSSSVDRFLLAVGLMEDMRCSATSALETIS